MILQCLTCLWLLALLAACGGSTALPSLDVDEIQAWRLPIDGPKLPAPRSVAVGMEGEVVVLDDAGRVLVFSRVGELLRRWSMPEVSVGRPEGVVVLDDGAIVVCDTHYHRIMVFEPTGETRRTFGSNGRGPGEFIYPVAIAADDEQNLYIGEYGSNDRIQKFTREGRFLKSFGTFGIEPGQFQRPSGIAWHEGRLYVADAVNNRIQVFKDDGTFERELVIRADEGEGVLSLHLPYDLAIGPAETLFVVEMRRRTHRGLLAGRRLDRCVRPPGLGLRRVSHALGDRGGWAGESPCGGHGQSPIGGVANGGSVRLVEEGMMPSPFSV